MTECVYYKYTIEEWRNLKKLAEMVLTALGDNIENKFELIDID